MFDLRVRLRLVSNEDDTVRILFRGKLHRGMRLC
jgi:hypothetical protein